MTDARKLYEIHLLVSVNRESPDTGRLARVHAGGRPLHEGGLVWPWQRLRGGSA